MAAPSHMQKNKRSGLMGGRPRALVEVMLGHFTSTKLTLFSLDLNTLWPPGLHTAVPDLVNHTFVLEIFRSSHIFQSWSTC